MMHGQRKIKLSETESVATGII